MHFIRFGVSRSLMIVVALYMMTIGQCQYEANWKSLDSRPLPAWFDEVKFGIMIHWGVYSVPSFQVAGRCEQSEWFWSCWKQNITGYVDFMKENYPPGFTYADFARDFTAEFFDANLWTEIFQASGAKYIAFTAKHHEGYTNWPSKYTFNWNSVDVGPNRDIVGELATAIRKTDIHFGLYYSWFEWYNPLYLKDQSTKFTTRDFVTTHSTPILRELVNTYKPELIWSDGDWLNTDTYWNSTGFLAWLYNESPVRETVVVDDRFGIGTRCKHGGYWTCDDRYNPKVLQKHKWENVESIDKHSFGYRRDIQVDQYFTIHGLLDMLLTTVSCGGNLLLNVGPTHDGKIVPLAEERLRQMGAWLGVNGEAIYATKPWTTQNDTISNYVWYTSKKQSKGSTDVYAMSLSWPKNNILSLGAPRMSNTTLVQMLGRPGNLKWTGRSGGGMDITIPPLNVDELPCQWAWVFKLINLKG